jgi:glyoxylase-like metal-dependent hydrolase (beta-lactamase superfamily II)
LRIAVWTGDTRDTRPNAVVIFDGQLLLPYADEVASYGQRLGKPIDRIILSHVHTQAVADQIILGPQAL